MKTGNPSRGEAAIRDLRMAWFVALTLAAGAAIGQGQEEQVNITTAGDQTAPGVEQLCDGKVSVFVEGAGTPMATIKMRVEILGGGFEELLIAEGPYLDAQFARSTSTSGSEVLLVAYGGHLENRARKFVCPCKNLVACFLATEITLPGFWASLTADGQGNFLHTFNRPDTELGQVRDTQLISAEDCSQTPLDETSDSYPDVIFDAASAFLPSPLLGSLIEVFQDGHLPDPTIRSRVSELPNLETPLRDDDPLLPRGAGGDFQVNSYTSSTWQGQVDVSVSASGEQVVVWSSSGSPGGDDSNTSIQARLFDSQHIPFGPQFQVNSHTPMYQFAPAVAYGPHDQFLVVWDSDSSAQNDDFGTSIQGRYYDRDGNPLQPPFPLTNTTIAIDDLQLETAAGAPGGQFQVNSYTTSSQIRPDVVPTADGFQVIWQSLGSAGTDQDGWSIQALLLPFHPVPNVFTDGFESGDLSAWSP